MCARKRGVMPTVGHLWVLIWKPYIHCYLSETKEADNMLRFFRILFLLGFCAFGCQSSNESKHGETSKSHDLPPPPEGTLLPPPKVLQTNSFANIKDLLPRVQKGMAEKELLKTLGYLHKTDMRRTLLRCSRMLRGPVSSGQ